MLILKEKTRVKLRTVLIETVLTKESLYTNLNIYKLIISTLKNIQILQLLVALVTFDAILWSNKTRNLTPFEIMTTLEGK